MNHERKTALDTLTPIQRRVVQDYYLTYPISQGSASMQNNLFEWIAMCYPQITRHDINMGNPAVHIAIESLRVPSHHIRTPGGSEDYREFHMNWTRFLRILYAEQSPATGNEFDSLALKIGFQIVHRDLKFIREGRPKQTQGNRYKSYFKSYILDDEPKDMHSDAFRLLFSCIKKNIEDIFSGVSEVEPVSQKIHVGHIHDLQKAWQFRHKGQFFFPQRQPYI